MRDFTGARVLVTGAGGFVGSHLCEELLRRGASVRAFLRYTSRQDVGLLQFADPGVVSAIDIVRGDIRDSSAILDAVAGCDVVFHLAALIGIPYSYVHPREVVDTNVMGSLNVFEAARFHRVSRVVHTSTSEVYGTVQMGRIAETHPLRGQSPYSASKIGADKIAESYVLSFETPIVTVRPFNTYGPRQSARAVIPSVIVQALTRPDVRLGSLSPTRDLTFVQNTVEGFLLAAEAEGVVGRTFNIGSSSEISVGDLARLIVDLTGRDVPIVEDPARVRPRRSEVERLFADAREAATVLGWKPTVSLREGLLRTIDWIRSHLDQYDASSYAI